MWQSYIESTTALSVMDIKNDYFTHGAHAYINYNTVCMPSVLENLR